MKNIELDIKDVKKKILEFDDENYLTDVILLGKTGAIRRIIFDSDYNTLGVLRIWENEADDNAVELERKRFIKLLDAFMK